MKLEEKAVKLLTENKLKIALAESCTGGLLAKKITDVSGASNVFECGIVCYSDRVKRHLVGVKGETIERFTAVSVKTAKEMASGIRQRASADIGVGITGYASPVEGLPDDEKVIIVAVSDMSGVSVESFRPNLTGQPGARALNRERAADLALQMIIDLIEDEKQ